LDAIVDPIDSNGQASTIDSCRVDEMTASETTDAKIYAEEFLEIARDGVPYVGQLGLKIEAWDAGQVQLRLPYTDLIQRPGGTICGPALMGLADVTLYGVVMSLLGRTELAVTTDLTFHFLSKPEPVDLLAEGRILKLGRRVAVGEVSITSEGKPQPICQAIGSYAIPPTID
jgi:uncharacterized protein (TIGR00369 family)